MTPQYSTFKMAYATSSTSTVTHSPTSFSIPLIVSIVHLPAENLPIVRPVAKYAAAPNAGKAALPACQYIKHTIAVHPARRARALHEHHQPEPIGTTRTRRPHRAKDVLQILQNPHDAHLQMTSLRSVPILANLPPSQVAAQATFSFVISIAKGMNELRPCPNCLCKVYAGYIFFSKFSASSCHIISACIFCSSSSIFVRPSAIAFSSSGI